MVDNTRLRAIGAGEQDATADPVVDSHWDDGSERDYTAQSSWEEPDEIYEEQRPARDFGWLAPALAGLAVAAWTGFYLWTNGAAMLAGASAQAWSRWIVDWSVPVVLVIGLWLLAMRNSRREAARFAGAARTLSDESERLELRLTTVNRELSLARDFIAAQSRDLEALGRIAAERLSQNADRLQGLIRDNGEQVETIGRVSSSALANMDRLRNDLPVISNSARDVTNQIANAGEVARGQLDEMIGGFGRLNDLGEASGRQVSALRGKVEQAVAAFEAQAEHLEDVLAQRFAALTERSATFRADLDGREVEAFAAMRRRADTLAQEVSAGAEQLAKNEREALAALGERMGQVRDEASRLSLHLRDGEAEARERWSTEIVALEERLVEAIRKITEVDTQATDQARHRLNALRDEAARFDEAVAHRVSEFDRLHDARESELSNRQAEALRVLDERLAAFDAQIGERQQEHLAHISGLTERSDALAARLRELSGHMDQLVAQARQTDGGLASAAGNFAAQLETSRATLSDSGIMVERLTDDSVRLLELVRASSDHTGDHLPKAIGEAEARLVAFESQARALGELITATGDKGAQLVRDVEAAHQGGAATGDQLAALDRQLQELASRSDALASHARGELNASLATLQTASSEALSAFQHDQAETIRALADRIGRDSSAAIANAVREHAAAVIAELEETARHANDRGRETAGELRDQLARINELASNLEQRVAHARQQAEEQVDADFTRRMALIVEALNSSAIDISKAFANDVTDTAWSSYLRGDRGIFTRRAVRLLDTQEARGIAEIYQEDADFRETVNRYIHDFEAMLRSVLSTRDGHALAVTLLSSDMGKLYVALAQAIDRLRA